MLKLGSGALMRQSQMTPPYPESFAFRIRGCHLAPPAAAGGTKQSVKTKSNGHYI
jgi:hypothetical protein